MTTAPRAEQADPPRDLARAEDVRTRTLSAISRLRGPSPAAVAGRAHLRSAVGKEVGSVPAIWSLTLESGSEKLLGNEPTRGEKAVHLALTLWALHQGSHDTPMHFTSPRGATIGSSVRRLAVAGAPDGQGPETHPVYRRLCAMIAAQTFTALAIQARGLIHLLSSADIHVDYGRLASDFYQWQDPRLRSRIIRQWGRDFARTPRSDRETPTPPLPDDGPAAPSYSDSSH
ncbi:type I-E CRISPR-associated protein Cse2/CasB [Actinomyces sp. B33]|uniref:type I-E CRISPR-associated protein Cse2/CasB n=1 Tax=Actinomyces sp. B33 TaxID=2942131 RepID=UPI0023403932|nr:type I-E CRISPR-associated protein Cse2/CasB [Actinomyces sp. B33]MDC4232364.1 type I-E CRISPR-associated protein Cse2/CasB [Actinomyces sp. B33]